MPDREKVTAWLNEIVNTLGSFTDESEQEVCQLAKDALALLKQEAVKPTWNRGKPFCGACGLRILGDRFCSECGKPIAWEGR